LPEFRALNSTNVGAGPSTEIPTLSTAQFLIIDEVVTHIVEPTSTDPVDMNHNYVAVNYRDFHCC
jgi:hypothetical protein